MSKSVMECVKFLKMILVRHPCILPIQKYIIALLEGVGKVVATIPQEGYKGI